MKLLKPNWVHHDDYPIFSVDVHPDSSRFATGGQGQDSGRIVIWNMSPVVDVKQENDPNVPRILCQMDHHIACVNVVRWSNNGLFLASGSDDKLIMIWHFVNGGGNQNSENWKCGYTLRAHNGDVLDLAWSAKDQFLASCSVDNTIIVWNALKFPDIITRINAHNGFVKGVAWDPVGTFFASQSDDKTLKIWKTLDWSLEKSVEEPFKECTGTTHVLRLNWSPDGQLLISAHAINNGVPTAQIIDRSNKWNTKLDFVGHRKAVTAVRFFPLIMKEEETKCKKVFCVCALGSRDRSISIWQTKASRPLCVLHDLFDNPIVDLSWAKRPKPALLACSMDGTIACLEFDYAEIGYPLTKQETEEFFMDKYNYDVNATISIKDTNVPQFSSGGGGKEAKENLKFIENYDILLAQERKQTEIQEKKQQQPQQNTPILTFGSNKPTQAENHRQIERRLPDGRRRITPICVSKPGEYDAPRPFVTTQVHQLERQGFSSSIGFEGPSTSNMSNASLMTPPPPPTPVQHSTGGFASRTATEQSTIIVEKRDETDRVVEISPVKSIVYSKQSSTNGGGQNHPSLVANNNTNSSCDVEMKSSQAEASSTTAPGVAIKVTGTSSNEPSSKSSLTTTSNLNNEKLEPKRPITPVPKPGAASKDSKPTTSEQSSKSQQPSTASGNKPATKQVVKPSSSSQQTKNQATQQQSSAAAAASNSNKQPGSKQPASKPSTATPTTTTTTTTTAITATTAETTSTKQTEVEPTSNGRKRRSSVEMVHAAVDTRYLVPLRAEPNTSARTFKIDNKKVTLIIENSVGVADKQTAHTSSSSSSSSFEETETRVSLLKMYENDKTLKWQTCFFSKICEASCNKYIVACACEDSTLSLIKLQQGTHICCPIVLDSRASLLHTSFNYCMCMSANGYVYVWRYDCVEEPSAGGLGSGTASGGNFLRESSCEAGNFFNLTAVISQLSCQFLLRDRALNKAFVTDSGVPVLQMSGNKSYFYSMQTKSWHLIPPSGLMNGPSGVAGTSRLQTFAHIESGSSNAFPLDEIQSRQLSSNLVKMIESLNKSISSNQQQQKQHHHHAFGQHDFTTVYLESQINAAAGLNSPKEYKFWLMTYARYLIENDKQDKLNELCHFLLGPLYSLNWTETIMGFKKRDLLKEILPIVAQNVTFQRIYTFFKKQLSLVESMGQKSSSSVLDRIRGSSSLGFGNKLPASQTQTTAFPIATSQQRRLESLLQPIKPSSEAIVTSETPSLNEREAPTTSASERIDSIKSNESPEPIATEPAGMEVDVVTGDDENGVEERRGEKIASSSSSSNSDEDNSQKQREDKDVDLNNLKIENLTEPGAETNPVPSVSLESIVLSINNEEEKNKLETDETVNKSEPI